VKDQVGRLTLCSGRLRGCSVEATPMRNSDWTPARAVLSDRAAGRPSDRPQVPPPDEAARQDSMLVAELATVNTLVARYVLRSTGVDNRDPAEISPGDERLLADRLMAAADGLRDRASRRERDRER
jgi:hypothetical protein